MATKKRDGRLPGYPQMNQTRLSCFMGMLFAKKCGINDPVLDATMIKADLKGCARKWQKPSEKTKIQLN